MFNLCFGFDLAWFGKLVQTQYFPVDLGNTTYVTNFHVRAACDLHLGLVFIASFSTCDCWYVNGTFLVITGEL